MFIGILNDILRTPTKMSSNSSNYAFSTAVSVFTIAQIKLFTVRYKEKCFKELFPVLRKTLD